MCGLSLRDSGELKDGSGFEDGTTEGLPAGPADDLCE